jgi:hypothetical protein
MIVVAAPLLLAACASSDFNPGPMPTGYTYQNRPYKAVPGPRPILMKKHMMENQTQDVMDYHPSWSGGTDVHMGAGGHSDWDAAAIDLINRMIQELGQPAEPVYVMPGEQPAFEQALRNAMQARNIPVTLIHGDGPFMIEYTVSNPGGMSAPDRLMANITLLVSRATPVEDVGGIYSVGAAHAMAPAPAPMDSGMMTAPAPVPAMDAPATTDGPVSTTPMPIMPMDGGN